MSLTDTNQLFINTHNENEDLSTKSYHQWVCYFHTDCFMARTSNGNYFHVVKKSTISQIATKFNCRIGGNEFWEYIGREPCISVLYDSNLIFDLNTFFSIIKIFAFLSNNQYCYEKVSPSDFVKKHILVQGDGTLILVNRHLIKKTAASKKYITEAWLNKVRIAMFPKSKSKTQSTNIPHWVNLPLKNLVSD